MSKIAAFLSDLEGSSSLLTQNIPSGRRGDGKICLWLGAHPWGPRISQQQISLRKPLCSPRGQLRVCAGCSPEPVSPLSPQSMWKTQRSTVKGYFLAGGQMVWWPVSTPVLPLLTNASAGPQPTSPNRNKQAKVTPVVCHSRIGFFPPRSEVAQPNASQNLAAPGDFQNSLGVPTTDTALC